MHPGSNVLSEQHVARDDRLLSDGRPTGKPEFAAEGAFVHLGALGEPRLLGVLRDDALKRFHVLEGTAHEQGIPDARAVIRKHPHPGATLGHRTNFGELAATEANRDGADGSNRDVARCVAECLHLFDDPSRVGDGRGVRHGVHGGKSANCRGLRPGQHSLAVLKTRLAQMSVEVDKAWEGHKSGGIDHRCLRIRESRAELGDHAVGDEDVGGGAVGQCCGANQDPGCHDSTSRSPDSKR